MPPSSGSAGHMPALHASPTAQQVTTCVVEIFARRAAESTHWQVPPVQRLRVGAVDGGCARARDTARRSSPRVLAAWCARLRRAAAAHGARRLAVRLAQRRYVAAARRAMMVRGGSQSPLTVPRRKKRCRTTGRVAPRAGGGDERRPQSSRPAPWETCGALSPRRTCRSWPCAAPFFGVGCGALVSDRSA